MAHPICNRTSAAAVAALLLLALTAVAAEHWAFQPVHKVEAPSVNDSAWVKTPIDRFILARVEAAGLKPASQATREQLIRRVTLGLIGLPPTPAEIDDFINDQSPTAFERVVDRLLSSPQYGERWARHWLDLARYAESDGFEHDAIRPHSWRFRDYVIGAFNEDKPYNRFVREQLAGDELWPEEAPTLIATGFNLLGPDMVDSADQIQRRLNTLNDMTDTAAQVFLGLTLGCARCHDHKSEPLTQRDYFSMQAFFAPAEFRREHPVPNPHERALHEAAMTEYNRRTRTQREGIAAIEAPHRQRLFEENLSKLSEDAQVAHRTPKEQRTMEQEGTVQETASQVKVTDEEVSKALSREEKARRAALESEIKRVPKPAALPMAMVLQNDKRKASKTHVLMRGDYNNPREEVQPAFPSVLAAAAVTHVTSSRRAALADWIASADNPLTARVMVNRIWQHHFGRGLVATASDFGKGGQPPTHPQLLNWLAGEFIRAGWSMKRLHKLILLSATYQQSSETTAETLSRDPENKLFSRQGRIRLDGEVLRDSLLAISGRLNLAIGGPGVAPPVPADITKTAKNWTPSPSPADHVRRSIYIFSRRNLRFPFLEVFDAPDSNLSCPQRGRSTTAPQSLTLLNSEETMSAASSVAEVLMKHTQSEHERIEAAFRLALGRRPRQNEMELAREFISETRQRQGAPPAAEWLELCRGLFNLNAFVYVE